MSNIETPMTQPQIIQLPIITVFGGSQCGPDSPEWVQAYDLGRQLAQTGFAVCTGGYQGTMAAASQGAHEAGGHVIGVTLTQLTSQINGYLTEERSTTDFYQRLQGLIQDSAGYIALRGGVGTLVEVTLVWNKPMTRALPPRPLVLIGRTTWQPWLDACAATLAVEPKHLALVTVVDTVEEAVAHMPRENTVSLTV
jgi:uncharacterized protein (TIGR00730 family)